MDIERERTREKYQHRSYRRSRQKHLSWSWQSPWRGFHRQTSKNQRSEESDSSSKSKTPFLALSIARFLSLSSSAAKQMRQNERESNEEALGFGFGRDLYCKIFLSFWRVSTAGNRGIRLYKVGHTDWELRRSSLWSSKPLKLCSWKIKSLVFVWCPSWETHTWRLSPDPRFCRN